jgi:hypothetical protein
LFLLALEAGFGGALFDVAFDFFDFLVHGLVVGALDGTLGA